jgi:hypothetical protein
MRSDEFWLVLAGSGASHKFWCVLVSELKRVLTCSGTFWRSASWWLVLGSGVLC